MFLNYFITKIITFTNLLFSYLAWNTINNSALKFITIFVYVLLLVLIV